MAPPWSLCRPATTEHLADFFDLVERWTADQRLDGELAAELRLIVEEACTNVVMHGFPDRPAGELRLELLMADGVAEVRVEDDGRPFDPGDAPPPDLGSDWRSRRTGGLGWHLIRGLSDDIRYQRVGERNLLVLRKRLAEP